MRLWPAAREDQRGVWKRGERAAARAMRRAGCRVIARNLVLGPGEIDLLCFDKRAEEFVVVEVKARIDHGDGRRPEDAITAAKKRKLVQLVRALQREERVRGRAIRVDVVAVVFAPGVRKAMSVTRYERAVRDETGRGRGR
jgi:putative endonuclease